MDKSTRYDWTRCAIAIRKRTLNETRDLALLVIGRNLKGILGYYAILGAPVFLLNAALFFAFISWVYPSDFFFYKDHSTSQSAFLSFVYLTIMLESSFVGSLVVQYLGAWLFAADPNSIDRKTVISSWFKNWKQIVYYLILTRPIRFSAFYPETILLEQTPFWRKDGRVTTRRRVAGINKRSAFRSGRLSTRFYTVNGVMGGAFLLMQLVLSLFPDKAPGLLVFDLIVFPIFAWGCELYHVVFNFCSYINYRIVSEGWDLELAFASELNRRGTTDEVDEEVARRRFRSGRTLGALTMDRDWESDAFATQDRTEEKR